MDGIPITRFKFYTKSFIKFQNDNNINNKIIALFKRRLENNSGEMDEESVMEWYKRTVLDFLNLEIPLLNKIVEVNHEFIEVTIGLDRFRNHNEFKQFLELTKNFVYAL